MKACGKLNVKAIKKHVPMWGMVWKILKLENGWKHILCNFWHAIAKQITAFTNMKQFSFGKIRYLFLTYQKFVMVFCLVFSKYFFENMGFLYTPLNGLWTHIQMVTKGKFITELKLRLCIKSVYNVKSLALTLSFPQAFKDAATERRAPPHP